MSVDSLATTFSVVTVVSVFDAVTARQCSLVVSVVTVRVRVQFGVVGIVGEVVVVDVAS